jgi:hypothetical protein
MKNFLIVLLFASVLILSVNQAGAQDYEPRVVASVFFDALTEGDGETVSDLCSTEYMETVRNLLDELKNSIHRDELNTTSRLYNAGYTASVEEILEWGEEEYLKETIALEIIQARYRIFEMEIQSDEISDREVTLNVLFISKTGLEISEDIVLRREDGMWKVFSFFGLNSFP